MGKFSRFLKRFTELKKLQAHWRNKGELEARRGAYMAVGAIVSAVSAIAVLAFTHSYPVASFVGTALLGFLIPSSIWLASKQWKQRFRTVIQDDDDFNWRMYLEDEYEDRIRRIENLGLAKKDTDRLKLEAYQEHETVLMQFQVSIASRPRHLPAPSIDEVQSILSNIRHDPRKRDMVERQIREIEEKSRKKLQLGP
jgi:hypothetical protein